MHLLPLLSLLLLYLACLLTDATPRGLGSVTSTCGQLQAELSNTSTVFLPGNAGYAQDVAHYFQSSVAASACSVEPGSTGDIGKILRIVGGNMVPFAIKGGGHATNPGFSSSSGVQISMTRFKSVVYHPSNGTVGVGTGLLWDDVYAALEPFNVTVVGGRISGIGVAGLTLGGGYSWFTNQYGLVVDNIVALEIVLPSGQLVTASEESNPDLFFALKGGWNNYGVVTQITFKTIPVGEVWGGFKIVAGDQMQAATNATARYTTEVEDPKAALITTYIGLAGQLLVSIEVFYNGPTPPPGIFDNFLAIPSVEEDIGTRSYLSLVQSAPSNTSGGPGTRGYYDTAPISTATVPIIDAIVNETLFWTSELNKTSARQIGYAVEIFLPSIFSHARPGSSAYPPTRSQTYFPLDLSVEWLSSADDQSIADAMTKSVQQLGHVASSQGQDVSRVPIYGNYAAAHSWPSERIFGDSLPRLVSIKQQYDPANVMGLTGGWKV